MFITVNGMEYELNTSLRTAKTIGTRFKMSLPELTGKLEEASIDELISILKLALIDKSQGQQLEDAILDGGWGVFELYSEVTKYLLALTYPGTDADKERQIEGAAMGEKQKNAIRAALGLPEKPISDPQDSGNS